MLDWRDIDTVLLDMDGTLLDLHFDSHFWLEHLPRRCTVTDSIGLLSIAARARLMHLSTSWNGSSGCGTCTHHSTSPLALQLSRSFMILPLSWV